jgi:hypothetical protein
MVFISCRTCRNSFTKATLEEKALILGSTFPEKLIFKNGEVRTACPQSGIVGLIKPVKGFSGNKKGNARFLRSLPVEWR